MAGPKGPPAPPLPASQMTPTPGTLTANGRQVQADLPCSIEEFLLSQKLLPRSVVVELNGEAVAPSEFSHRHIHSGDRLEIVKIVAGG
jgi:thiamine biosynthesis protein ThiS